MFIAVLFTIARSWKQPKCSLINESIKKMLYIYIYTHRYIHTMEYYSAIKKNRIMPFAATRMELEVIILSDISQTKKNTI